MYTHVTFQLTTQIYLHCSSQAKFSLHLKIDTKHFKFNLISSSVSQDTTLQKPTSGNKSLLFPCQQTTVITFNSLKYWNIVWQQFWVHKDFHFFFIVKVSLIMPILLWSYRYNCYNFSHVQAQVWLHGYEACFQAMWFWVHSH